MSRSSKQRRDARAKSRAREARARPSGQAFGRPPGFGWAELTDQGRGPSMPPAPDGPRAVPSDREIVDLFLEIQRVDAVGLGTDHPVYGALVDVMRRQAGLVRVTTVLTRILQSQVDAAWRYGWQPADLHHLGRRHLGEQSAALLRDIMAKDLNAYAGGTIAPRWPAQLADIDARVWWARDTDPLRVRIEVPGRDAPETVRAAAALGVFLESLPPLAVLDPLPGKARPAPAPLPDDVDVRLLTRVRQLLAQAESTTFEAEAETFSARAQALMARHSLDAATLSAGASQSDRERPSALRVHIIRPYEGPKTLLLDAVAKANRCRTVWSKALGFVTVIGHPPDLVAVESLFTSLLVQADRAMLAEGRRTTSWGQTRTRSFRQSFLMAYAARIGERLQHAADDEVRQRTGLTDDPVDEATRSPRGSGPANARGRELVQVLRERSAEVDGATQELFPELVEKAVSHAYDLEGWGAGRSAADRATLFDAAAVETG